MQLNQKAKARREQGLFVAEGRKMFLEAPENWVFQVFVSETFSQDGELMAQVEKYPYEIVKDSVFRQMCDTKTPQGILTVLKLPSWSEEEVLAGENPLSCSFIHQNPRCHSSIQRFYFSAHRDAYQAVCCVRSLVCKTFSLVSDKKCGTTFIGFMIVGILTFQMSCKTADSFFFQLLF